MNKIKIDKETFINVCKNSKSMRKASIKLNIPFTTFSRYAKKFNVYKTNQAGKGISKKNIRKIPLVDILNGKHFNYKTSRLHERLIKEGYKKEECEICKIKKWNNKKLSFELDHVDGNNSNNNLNNLRIICPNCHSQTDSYRGRNKKYIKKDYISNEKLINAIKTTTNIRQALIKVGLQPKGANYKRAYKIMCDTLT